MLYLEIASNTRRGLVGTAEMAFVLAQAAGVVRKRAGTTEVLPAQVTVMTSTGEEALITVEIKR